MITHYFRETNGTQRVVEFPNITNIMSIMDLNDGDIVAIIEEDGYFEEMVKIHAKRYIDEFTLYMSFLHTECTFFNTTDKHDDEYNNHVCNGNCIHEIPLNIKWKIIEYKQLVA